MARSQKEKFSLGSGNLQSLNALHKKFFRDYLKFFKELSKMYSTGKMKQNISETIQLIEKTTTLLEDVISEGQIGVQDSEKLYNQIQEIEDKKKFFLEELPKVKAFQEKITKVEGETGISLDDLNVTQEIARKSVVQARRKSKDGIFSQLQKNMPTTYNLGANAIQAAGVAALGPFYPIAKLGAGLGKDIFKGLKGIGEGIQNKREEGLSSKLLSSLRTSSTSSDNLIDYEKIKNSRSAGAPVTDFRGYSNRKVSVEEQMIPLREFFDKGAYKTKWTKELLENTKSDKDSKAKFTDNLSEKLENLGAYIIPLIGKAGMFAGLAAATVFTTNRVMKLGSSVKEFLQVQENVKAELIKQSKLQAAQKDRLDVALGNKLQTAVKSGDETARATAVSQIQQVETERAQKEASETGAWEDWKSGVQSIFSRKKSTVVKPKTTMSVPPVKKSVKKVSDSSSNLNSASSVELGALNKNLEKLIENVGKQNTSVAVPSVRKSGNPFDSADTLLNDYSKGRFTLD